MTLLDRICAGDLPRHVALIMDGNGRWAATRGLPRAAGHRAGALAAERLIRFLGARLPIPYVTLFAFSSENWARPPEEVSFLMRLLGDFLRDRLAEFAQAGIQLRVIGDLSRVPATLRHEIEEAVRETRGNGRLHVTIALSYGGRQDIVAAARRMAADVAAGSMREDEIDEASFGERLATAGMPDPDLVIRTSGEERLSNFLLWQCAYAELHFTPTLWPDFAPAEFLGILAEYQGRTRRFGAVAEVGA